ncbi:MAG: hypothetical protein EKK42_20155 [Pseudonocardiaceae bacterium]|nr:MAG: hypothetical protein EKK42_20155 [Pseudonocardiaceae bacterium]
MRVTFNRGDECPAGLTEVTDEAGDHWTRNPDDTWNCREYPHATSTWRILTDTYSGDLTGEVPTAEPRVWTPAAPDDVQRVRDADGQVWVRGSNPIHWYLEGESEYPRSWSFLLNSNAPLTEVTETEFEGALRRLRGHGIHRGTWTQFDGNQTIRDIQLVVSRAIENLEAENNE